MRIILKSTIAKIVAMVLEVLAFLAFAVWVGRTYLADLMARRPTVQTLGLAVQLDPDNSDYRLRLGRLLQYSLTDIDPDKAFQQLSRAIELNAYDPQAWLGLGAVLELQGKTSQAEASLRRADFLAPNLPVFQWSIANFFLLHGNVDEAFRHFKVVLAGTNQYDQVIFNTAWKASGDADKILEELIPHHAGTEFDYLYYLLAHQRYAEAKPVWRRIADGSEGFPPPYASGYIDSLIRERRPEEAYQVWSDVIKKGLIRATQQETQQNRIVNGDFEEGVLNMGFDWRISPAEGAYVGLDQTTFHSASHSLLIQFLGKQNVNYGNVFQYVRVSPGQSYRVAWAMKTEGITTDSGPRVEVRDAYDPRALDQLSESVTGTTEGWSSSILDFTAGPKTDLVAVIIARRPSLKLDNLIAGKVWVDDVSLTPRTGEEAHPKKVKTASP